MLAASFCAVSVPPLIAAASAAAAGPCGPPVTSVIACENSLPGDPPSDWQVNGIGDSTIQGYATSMSVNVGQTISFKIKTPASSYHIDILRLGYYGGNGARKIAAGLKPTATLPQTQPSCLVDSTTGLIDCGNWSVSASWTVPSNAVSGIYIAHLVRNDTGGSSQIPFVVRDDSSHSDVLVSTSDATWQAYNDYGGNSLYTCTVSCPPGNPLAYKAAYAVSYNRPWDGSLATDGGASYVYYAEYQLVRFLEQNGYDVSYTSSSDVDNPSSGALLKNHKLFISSGHDEYWSQGQRANVTAARNAGVNLAFFSANEVFWKTRWGASQDGSNTPYRTLTTYKETHFDAPTDPQDPPTWTGTWADPRFSPPADGGQPQNALTGQEFIVNSGTTDIKVPAQYAKLRIWRNTSVANLSSGQSATLGSGTGTLGYEWDEDADNGFRPAGLLDMSSTTASAEIFTDYGSLTATAPATHHLTLYRAPSGAMVFGAGTVQWSWGLDNTNAWNQSSTDPSGNPPDRNMQQATVNLFGDMGVQPATLMSGLVSASPSTDTTPPTSTITSPSAGTGFQDGTKVTITGSATDSGGGVVAGVEVSADGGVTWHPATLTGADAASVGWSYTWIAHGSPSTTLESRAVDDSGNIETPSDAATVNLSCPCSLWGPNATPIDQSDSGDTNSTEVGVQFKSDVFGTVSGLRFYKVSTNTGTHVGSLWTSTGQLLAQATFSGETASGWQQVNFSNPVAINPNTTYVVSYYAPNGHYASTQGYFYPSPSPAPDWGSTVDSRPLHALRNITTTVNGVYAYTSGPAFPSSTFSAENYWVDPIFSPAPPPGQVTGVSANAGNGSAYVTWTAPTGGGPATSYMITPYANGLPQMPTTVSGTPAPTSAMVAGLTNGTTYTFTVTASNPNGSGPASAASNAVTPSASIVVPSFVQQASAHSPGGASLSATPTSNVTAGDRLVVLAAIWSSSNATAASVTDSAGNAYVELLHFTAPDGTEESVWTAPITKGGGTRPSITLKPTSSADIGLTVSEYSGLAAVSDASVMDQSAHASGTTSAATSVASGPTAPTGANYELAIGMYVDSGFSNSLIAASGYTQRVNVSPTADVELLSEDQILPTSGATPNASVGTGGSTPWAMATVVLKSGTSTTPGAPTGVSATAGNGSANVSWTAPANGGSPITSYTVTPYLNGTSQQPSTTVNGSPPATSTTITGLTNGSSYTFTVTATNAVGPGPASAPSNSVTPAAVVNPAFVQQVTAHGSASSLAVTPGANVTAGDRLVVLVGVWNSSNATAKSVTDAAGNTYTEILHFAGSDGTEESVWSAPVTAGGGTKPKITATATSAADIGVAALEYSGLSTASGTGAVDQTAQKSGTTSGAATVSSGATPATSTSNELALGFYVDSGFGDTLSAGSGFTSRANVSNTSDMEFLVEDQVPAQGATPNASAGTGASTTWLMSTIVLKHA